MENAICASVETVLILKADQLYADLLRQHVQHEFPHARITLVTSVDAAATVLAAGSPDLLVTGLGATAEGDVLDLLARRHPRHLGARHVLVVTTRREYRLLAALKSLAVTGVFDTASEAPGQFSVALRSTAAGAAYWSATFVELMHRVSSTSTALFRMLTIFEQVVLSVVGDGSDDDMAAHELGLSPLTVSTVRRELHRKLGIQHRGQLVRLAAQHGFVRFTPTGVVRPGFSLLAEAYNARRTRRPGAVRNAVENV